MGITMIKISSEYFAVGILLGYYMSSTHSYLLGPVHVHINLLGWTSLTLAGILYYLFPALAVGKAGMWHFWLHNIGLPIMMLSLSLVPVTENNAFLSGTAVGATFTAVAIMSFVWNLLKNLKAD
ncbi:MULTISPECIES: cytochrome-c oxidase [unclassified Cytobacillus]|uniref:cytochrome-c oxidase n=1 Tax=unclassified Cytobacillus TaxID=2675268 RepID=UPI00135808B1|nr:cytochrome-c oxidase [Cytobacillus sp. AMY 15.2]KAF0820132.1 hypothetical protein KIS4809_0712 [Bacillus sp. ZZV12-4809]MCM3090318.1 cbb3-type cytochrome c oxidase subunit I [Cytobacillus sp. AMY 15.2]